MKGNLFLVIAFLLALDAMAQPQNGYTGPHVFYGLTENENVAEEGNRSLTFVVASFRWEVWHPIDNLWLKTDSISYNYNINRILTGYTALSMSGSNWVNRQKTIYTLNMQDKLTEGKDESWINQAGQWRNQKRESYIYDNNQNVTEYLVQYWDTTANAWSGRWRYFYTYDTYGNELTKIMQDGISGVWVNLNKYTGTWDVDNNRTGYLLELWDNVNSNWKNEELEQSVYDSNRNHTFQLNFKWKPATSSWDSLYRRYKTYNATNKLENNMRQDWMSADAVWQNNSREELVYLGEHINEVNRSYWSWLDSAWVPSSRYLLYYDGNDNKIREVLQQYNSVDQVYQNYLNFLYFFTGKIMTDISKTESELNICASPNPVIDNVRLSFTLSQPAPVDIILYDINGCRLVQQTATYNSGAINIELPSAHLPCGNYFVSLINKRSGETSMLKIIKQ